MLPGTTWFFASWGGGFAALTWKGTDAACVFCRGSSVPAVVDPDLMKVIGATTLPEVLLLFLAFLGNNKEREFGEKFGRQIRRKSSEGKFAEKFCGGGGESSLNSWSNTEVFPAVGGALLLAVPLAAPGQPCCRTRTGTWPEL